MVDTAIKVENLGKMYRIGGPQERYSTFRDVLSKSVTAPFRRARDLMRGQAYGASGLKEEIWALRDMSFEVKRGEVVGIIGRNGAGKSTLLKILSRITEPTTGYVDIYGRVGALLEVGTGFHPELTGRENVYLNGAILGMSRRDINHKFDEIVDFSGVGKFIDTPVKHYSSGMGLRLGFAVAAHLEPEILVVDEVLAVGDAEFQKKCLGKMQDVASEGRTVLFVSHNMAAVESLCTRGILLNEGMILMQDKTETVIRSYLSNSEIVNSVTLKDREDRTGTGDIKLTSISMIDEHDDPTFEIMAGSAISFLVCYEAIVDLPVSNLLIVVRIEDTFGRYLFSLSNEFTGTAFDALPSTGCIRCNIPTVPLLQGEYTVYVSLYQYETRFDALENALQFTVHPSDIYGSSRYPKPQKHGPFFVEQYWGFQNQLTNSRDTE